MTAGIRGLVLLMLLSPVATAEAQQPGGWLSNLNPFKQRSPQRGRGALADSRGDPSDDSMAYIASCKNAGHAGFHMEWVAPQLPILRPLTLANQVLPGVDEAGIVQLDHAVENTGSRHSAWEPTARCS